MVEALKLYKTLDVLKGDGNAFPAGPYAIARAILKLLGADEKCYIADQKTYWFARIRGGYIEDFEWSDPVEVNGLRVQTGVRHAHQL